MDVMITKITKGPTWFQRKVSPLATSAASMFFQNRKAVACGIRAVTKRLSPEEKFVLRIALNKFGILQRKFRVMNISDVEHYHLSKKITTTRLTLAAHEFRRNTGRDDFVMILPELVSPKASERLQLGLPQIDYRQKLYTIKPRIMRELQERAMDEVEDENFDSSAVLDQAFELAARFSHVSKDELIYRMRKMPDMGGDLQAVVASLFMDLPVKKIANYLGHSQSAELQNLLEPICKMVQRYQFMRNNFKFNPAWIRQDPKYIYRKMCELVRGARTPRVLLLFFLDKLAEAREAQGRSTTIFSEIRFLLAPLAERLGLVFLADDLRDQYLRLGSPAKYDFVTRSVQKRIGMDYDRAKMFLSIYAREIFGSIQEKLGADVQGVVIKFRVKSAYSIWNKVEIRQEYSYDELNDILGVKIICDSEVKLKKIRDILKKSNVFSVKAGDIKEVLGAEERGKWKGVKMIGQEVNLGVPIEVQIMTREMDNANKRGKAATWHYNLKKELGDVAQVFDKRESKEVMGSNFFVNFYEIRNYWTVPANEIK